MKRAFVVMVGLALAVVAAPPALAQLFDGKAYWPNPTMGARGRYLYAVTLERPFWRFIARNETWDVFSLVSMDDCAQDDYAWLLVGADDERLAVIRGSNACDGISTTSNLPAFTAPRFIDLARLPMVLTGRFAWSTIRMDTHEQIDHGVSSFASVIAREFAFGQWTYKIRVDVSDHRGDSYEILWFGEVPLCEARGASSPGVVAYQTSGSSTVPVQFCWHTPDE